MIKLKNTFGNMSTDQFSSEVLVFLKTTRETTSTEAINQGIKALSIMFLNIKDKNDQCIKLFRSSIKAQIDFERNNKLAFFYNSDSVDIRSDLSLESALSHERL
jgi:hypothetical protein